MEEIAFEELAEYASAYSKAAGHVSVPLGKDKLPMFVKELYPQEFFPEHIMNSLVQQNSNIVPFDFLSMIRALVIVSKSIRVAPRQTTGVRKLKLSEALQLSKLFIDMDQDKDGLVQSTHYAYANLDSSKLPPLSTYSDLVRSAANSYTSIDLQGHSLRSSASGEQLIHSFAAPQPVFASFQSPPLHQQQPGAMQQLQQPLVPQQYGNAQQQFQQQQNMQQQAQYQQYLHQQQNQGNPFLQQSSQQQQFYPQQSPQQHPPQQQYFNPQPFVSPQQPNNLFSPPQQQPQYGAPQQPVGPPHPSGISPRQNYSPRFPQPMQSPVMPSPQQQPLPPLQPLQPMQPQQIQPQQPSPFPAQPAQPLQPRAQSPPMGAQLDTVTLLKLFNLADKDASGMLTADELVPIVRGVVRPGIPVTAQHSQMLMKMLDKDGSGAITIDEFLEGAKKFNWNADVLTDLVAKAQRPLSTSSSGGDLTADIEIAYNEIALGDRIGEGTFGLVYKGAWRGSPVAIKMLKMANITDHALQEFRKELQILARLRHPNIVLLMGASTTPPNLTFVTEFLAGGSLFDKLQAKKITIDANMFKRMAREIAQGMNYLHLSGIIHRDLKSLNILLDHNNTVKICDFGLSKMKTESDVMTKKVGTPIWMAPELIRGEDYNEKVDVYAYGIILWELGTGELPYPKMDSIQIAVAVSSKGLRPPIPEQWPPFLKELAQACWHEDPKMRPTFNQILERLSKWV